MSGLSLDTISVRHGERTLVDGVSLRVEAGQFVALVGPNGAGKTTLLRAALGLVSLASGRVSVNECELATLTQRDRAAELAWLPQHTLASEPLPAIEAVIAARYRFAEAPVASRRAAERTFERLGLTRLANLPLTRLSGGERQRVAIAALLAQEARFLLLDEPANHLDPAQQAETYALLGRLLSDGIGILCVTHDVNLLANVASPARVLGVAGGKLRFERDFIAPDLPRCLSELFGVRMVALPLDLGRVIVPAPRAVPEPDA